jgi:hypothetical protein
MKTYWGNGGIAAPILNVGTRWRREVSFKPRPLYSRGKNSLFPLEMWLSGPNIQSGRGGEEKNVLSLPRVL